MVGLIFICSPIWAKDMIMYTPINHEKIGPFWWAILPIGFVQFILAVLCIKNKL